MNSGKFEKGISGNPDGRPPKIKGKITIPFQGHEDDLQSTIESALEFYTALFLSGKIEMDEADGIFRVLQNVALANFTAGKKHKSSQEKTNQISHEEALKLLG